MIKIFGVESKQIIKIKRRPGGTKRTAHSVHSTKQTNLTILQGTLGRCPSPIFYALTCVAAKRQMFFLIWPNRIFGGENRLLNWGTEYPLNCFTYTSGIFHNETNWENFLTMRNEKCDFLNFFEIFLL